MTNTRFPECSDCVFDGVEPAICDECEDADQYQETEDDEAQFVKSAPLYFHNWKKAA